MKNYPSYHNYDAHPEIDLYDLGVKNGVDKQAMAADLARAEKTLEKRPGFQKERTDPDSISQCKSLKTCLRRQTAAGSEKSTAL